MSAFGVHGRSAEQRIALAHLLDDEIGIVSLGGPAGTGTSVLAIAAAPEMVLERRTHKRIMVFRPIMPVGGQDLDFLPGTEEEKLNPWAAAVYDALRAITNDNVIEEVRSRDILEILPLTHIRGRTLGPGDDRHPGRGPEPRKVDHPHGDHPVRRGKSHHLASRRRAERLATSWTSRRYRRRGRNPSKARNCLHT
jgi:hypothetical protein